MCGRGWKDGRFVALSEGRGYIALGDVKGVWEGLTDALTRNHSLACSQGRQVGEEDGFLLLLRCIAIGHVRLVLDGVVTAALHRIMLQAKERLFV